MSGKTEYRAETFQHVSNQLLIGAINARKWKECCKIAYNDEVFVKIKDPLGNLPIHLAVKNGCTHDLLLLLLTAFPESAWTRDANGNLPIHLACSHHAGRLWISISELTMTLIDAYAAGLREFDCGGSLPIQLAVRSRGPDELIRYLLKLFPESGFIKDRLGNTLVHLAIQFDASINLLNDLISDNPDAIGTKNKLGMLPLHKACQVNSSLEVFQILLRHFPAAASAQDDRGNLPLHLMFLFCGGRPTEAKLTLMLSSYPSALGAINRNGSTPFMMMNRPQDNNVDDYI